MNLISIAMRACLSILIAIFPLVCAEAQGTFTPSKTKTLAQFGAVGDGLADDTASIRSALSQSDRFCLDGQNRSYRIVGTLKVEKNLCLRRITLKQSLVPFDTSPYNTEKCPVISNPFIIVECGNVPVPDDQLANLKATLALRTLFIRPADSKSRILVNLDHVTVDRGPYPYAGSRQDAAGIWLEGARRVDFKDVEITGGGKGYGLLLIRSENVTLINLNIHDIIWSPFRGDVALNKAKLETLGWNAVPIHEFRFTGESGAIQNKFYGVRIQEQVTCAYIAEVRNVTIRGAKISRCMARMDDGLDLPWQTDGLDIGGASANILVTGGTRIENVWEGMDVVASGQGIRDLTLDRVHVENSFSFGLKLGYALTGVKVLKPLIKGVGLAGIILYGPVRDAIVADARIDGVGGVVVAGSRLQPWAANTRVAIRLDEGSGGTVAEGFTPDRILIKNALVRNSADLGSYEYGFLNNGATNVALRGSEVRGYRVAMSSGF